MKKFRGSMSKLPGSSGHLYPPLLSIRKMLKTLQSSELLTVNL
jgi:hypothetical protein